jgi:RHS repeat-associated protein
MLVKVPFGAVFSCLLSVAPLAAVTVPGHTAGRFQVGESGEASYSIPITGVPGTAGLEPQLALTYSSQGFNSLLGVGWSLSGLSVISRCPATVAQDTFMDPVDFDAADRFCLDGERLMVIAGVYGANATEYRTEQNSFRRVISNGQAGTGPASFTVKTKSGLTFEYGGTDDSRIEAQGKTSVLFWAVNRISDTRGNYFTVTYTEEYGEYRPERIDYTANDAASLELYASIELAYEARPDATPQFISGSLLKTTWRLSSVRAYEGEDLYREYLLAYEVSAATGASRLASVTECGSDGSCFAPTTFAWQSWADSDFNFNGPGSGNWPGHSGGISNNFLGDYNGDGKTDIMGYTGSGGLWHVVLSNGSGFDFGPGFWSGHAGGSNNNFLGDFNGDGKTDIMGHASAGNWNVSLSSGSGFQAPGSGVWSGHSGGTTNNFLGDFNGDGRTDIMSRLSQGNWHVSLSSGSGFEAPSSGPWGGHGGTTSNNFLGDFNGDGLTDIMGRTGVGGLWHVTLSNGTSFGGAGSGNWSGHSGTTSNNFLGDFNGDGKTDIMGYTGSGGLWHVALSDGTNFNAPGSGTFWQGHDRGSASNFLGDYNGDGKTDIAGYKANGIWTVCLSTGSNFACREWAGHPAGTNNNFLGDFDGDGKTDSMRYGPSSGSWHVTLSGGLYPDLLTGVTDGHGVATSVTYASITDPDVYTKGTAAVYPEQDFQGPLYVVASYTTSDGIGGTYPFSHHYAEAKVHLQGRGFRGFGRATVTDDHTGLYTNIFYERAYHCVSTKIRRIEQRQSDGTLISEVDNTIAVQDHGFGVHFSFVSASIARNYELDSSLIATVVTATDVDTYGNVNNIAIDYGDGLTETTVNSYDDDLDSWYLGRLTRTEVTRTAPGQTTQIRTSAFTYDPVSGQLTSEIIEPDHPTLRLTKTYQHDPFGNITVSTTSGPGITSRSHTTAYTFRGRFVRQSINALGQVESKTQTFGNVTSLTGPNLLTTTWEYDGFGRQTQELRADGTQTLTVYRACDLDCPAGGVYFVRSDATGSPVTTTYFDLLDRVIRKETQGFDGTPIYVDSKYNKRGFTKWVSEPYFAGDTPIWTEYQYDDLGRPTAEIAPGNRETTTSYVGRTTTVTNPLNQINIRKVDARGQLVESSDNFSGMVSYVYDAFGNLVVMEDPVGNTTTFAYDIRGNCTSIDDPDTGVSTFVYNTLGELVSQTDAKGNTVTLAYDLLGRLRTRTEPEGTSTWTYDTRPAGIGKLSQVSRGDYLEEYFYDSLGRVDLTRITIAGEVFAINTGYDLMGRPDILIYPSGYGVRTLYNNQGYPQELRRTSDNQALWMAQVINARGQLEQAALGNGLVTTRDFDPETGRIERIQAGAIQDLAFTFDDIGNLTSREDVLRGLSETFDYDGLNRLSNSRVAGRPAVFIGYDELGNIVSKSDVGIYTYGGNGAGPHAVTSISGPKSANYLYDANGNLTQRQRLSPVALLFADGFESGSTSAWNQTPPPPLPATAIAYTSFNKPRSITQGTINLTFAYGPDYSRYRQVVTTPAGVTTKRYAGGLFERETTGTTTRDIHYVQAGGEVFAVYTTLRTGTSTLQSTRYLHRDHLGSVQTISSETGSLVEVLSFDPWGLRRNAQNWTAAESPVGSTIDRGFTGHEHLDEVELIHMNGRVYDPVIGRFLSADPVVQVPEFSQSLNRYSYVLNNPLALTDPSGYFFNGLFRAIRRLVSNTFKFIQRHASTIISVIGLVTGHPFLASIVNSIYSGIQSGAGFGEILRGTITSAAISAATALAFGAVGSHFGEVAFGSLAHLQKVIAHGVIGGLSRVAQGGKFEHGFLSAAVTQTFAPAIDGVDQENTSMSSQRILAASIVGGTAESIGGGKFANGAITGAFSRIFNDEAHLAKKDTGYLSRTEIDTELSRIPGCTAGTTCNSVRVWNRIFGALGIGDGVAATEALRILQKNPSLATSTKLSSHFWFQTIEQLTLFDNFERLTFGEKMIAVSFNPIGRTFFSYSTSRVDPFRFDQP